MGTLYPWPIPTSTTLEWVIYHWTAITSVSALGTTVTLPPGYEELLITHLAIRLASPYGRTVDPDLRMRASQAKAIVERANFRVNDLSFGGDALIGGGGWFNPWTGE
jgi:hypothetical protein